MSDDHYSEAAISIAAADALGADEIIVYPKSQRVFLRSYLEGAKLATAEFPLVDSIDECAKAAKSAASRLAVEIEERANRVAKLAIIERVTAKAGISFEEVLTLVGSEAGRRHWVAATKKSQEDAP